MSRQTITIEGIPELKAALARKVAQVKAAEAEVVAQGTEDIAQDARREAPVDKGDLRRGIHDEADGSQGTVKATARHSTFMEHGTYKDKAQPFMQPAANRARRRIPKMAADLFRRALGG